MICHMICHLFSGPVSGILNCGCNLLLLVLPGMWKCSMISLCNGFTLGSHEVTLQWLCSFQKSCLQIIYKYILSFSLLQFAYFYKKSYVFLDKTSSRTSKPMKMSISFIIFFITATGHKQRNHTIQ